MKQTTYNLAKEKEAGDFVGRREQNWQFYWQKKAGWLMQGHFPLGVVGVCQAGDLTSADHIIPDGLA